MLRELRQKTLGLTRSRYRRSPIQSAHSVGALGGAIGIVLAACSPSPPTPTVTILGSITGDGEATIAEVLAPFEEANGIDVVYEGTDQFATVLIARLTAGNPPDIALFPQPGLMADLAREGDLLALDDVLSNEQLESAFDRQWLELASVDDRPYGIWARASLKSLVWYSPPVFAAAGYEVPSTWEELQALSDRMVSDGNIPWCIGLESGAASGWPGTDWVEEFVLRQSGPEVYDRWVGGETPFSEPAIASAFNSFAELVQDGDRVLGGAVGAISTPFGDSPAALFDDPPGCYLHRQASFISTFFPDTVEPGRDVAVFPFPAMNPEFSNVLLVSGEQFGLLSDTPEARAMMEYLTTAEPHRIWSQAEGFVSPFRGIAIASYTDPNTRKQAEVLASADTLRFDGSDLMPGEVGTGAFWEGIIDLASGTADLDTVLADIDRRWPQD
ncbi:MAG: ABC transporter substrate-binding protein [Cyanobacteria bacterium P01_A01_bin.3]